MAYIIIDAENVSPPPEHTWERILVCWHGDMASLMGDMRCDLSGQHSSGIPVLIPSGLRKEGKWRSR